MRHWVFAAAGLLAACSAEITTTGTGDDPTGGYTLQIVATDASETYYVTGPDDISAAARIVDGVSALIDSNEARLAVGEARATAADLAAPPERLAVRVPGFEMSIAAEDKGAGADGRARISINAGGRAVSVDANGSGADNAVVRITGADEGDARNFIRDADGLSSETKQQMLAALGLTSR